MRVIPVSLCNCSFQICKKYYLTRNPEGSQTGKTGLVTKAQDSSAGAALAEVPELQPLPTINLPSLRCWNLPVCWPSGCRETRGWGIFHCFHNKIKRATGFFKSYEFGSPRPTLGILCPSFGYKDNIRAQSKTLLEVGHSKLISGMTWLCFYALWFWYFINASSDCFKYFI